MSNTKLALWLATHFCILLVGVVINSAEILSKYLGQSLVNGVGTSFVATGLAGFIILFYMHYSEDMFNSLNTFKNAGFLNVFSGRSTTIKNEYTTRISSSKNIDIIGYGLSAFREDYRSELQSLSRSKIIRILVVDPEFPSTDKPFTDIRDIEEHQAVGTIRTDVNELVNLLKGLTSEGKGGISIRYATYIPSINYFRVDHEIFWGPYLVGSASRNTVTMLIEKNGYVGKQLSDHFELVWSDDRFSRAAY